MTAVLVLEFLEPDTAVKLKSALLFFCTFAFGQGLSDLYDNVQILQVARPFCGLIPGESLQDCCDKLPHILGQQDFRCQANLLSWTAPGALGYIVCPTHIRPWFMIILICLFSIYFATGRYACPRLRCLRPRPPAGL
jgi:hypothetical protein